MLTGLEHLFNRVYFGDIDLVVYFDDDVHNNAGEEEKNPRVQENKKQHQHIHARGAAQRGYNYLA